MTKHRYNPDEAAAAGVIALFDKRMKDLGCATDVRAAMPADLRARVDDAVRWHERHQTR